MPPHPECLAAIHTEHRRRDGANGPSLERGLHAERLQVPLNGPAGFHAGNPDQDSHDSAPSRLPDPANGVR